MRGEETIHFEKSLFLEHFSLFLKKVWILGRNKELNKVIIAIGLIFILQSAWAKKKPALPPADIPEYAGDEIKPSLAKDAQLTLEDVQISSEQEEQLKQEQIQDITIKKQFLLSGKTPFIGDSETEAGALCLGGSCQSIDSIEDVSLLAFYVNHFLNNKTQLEKILKETLLRLSDEKREQFLKELASSDHKIKAMIIESAVQMDPKIGLGILNAFKKDPSAVIREKIARTAGLMGKKAVSILHDLKDDPNPAVVHRVAYSAGEIGKEGFSILKELSEKHPNRLRIAHAVMLAKQSTNDLESKKTLDSMMNSILQNTSDQQTKIYAAGELKQASVVMNYMKSNPQPESVYIIAHSADNFGKRKGFKILNFLIDNVPLNVPARRAIVRSAGVLGGDRGNDIALSFSADPDPQVRDEVLNHAILNAVFDKKNKSFQTLHAYKKDSDEKIAQKARRAYQLMVRRKLDENNMKMGGAILRKFL